MLEASEVTSGAEAAWSRGAGAGIDCCLWKVHPPAANHVAFGRFILLPRTKPELIPYVISSALSWIALQAVL
jgi:hypothetical protein